MALVFQRQPSQTTAQRQPRLCTAAWHRHRPRLLLPRRQTSAVQKGQSHLHPFILHGPSSLPAGDWHLSSAPSRAAIRPTRSLTTDTTPHLQLATQLVHLLDPRRQAALPTPPVPLRRPRLDNNPRASSRPRLVEYRLGPRELEGARSSPSARRSRWPAWTRGSRMGLDNTLAGSRCDGCLDGDTGG
jgi:hypothetical protein